MVQHQYQCQHYTLQDGILPLEFESILRAKIEHLLKEVSGHGYEIEQQATIRNEGVYHIIYQGSQRKSYLGRLLGYVCRSKKKPIPVPLWQSWIDSQNSTIAITPFHSKLDEVFPEYFESMCAEVREELQGHA